MNKSQNKCPRLCGNCIRNKKSNWKSTQNKRKLFAIDINSYIFFIRFAPYDSIHKFFIVLSTRFLSLFSFCLLPQQSHGEWRKKRIPQLIFFFCFFFFIQFYYFLLLSVHTAHTYTHTFLDISEQQLYLSFISWFNYFFFSHSISPVVKN